jgi:flagellar hook-associated protein 2
MAGLTLGGLSSGMDTQAVIDQLMQIERQPETRLKLRQSAIEARQTALQDVASRLRNLEGAVKDLGSVGTWASTQSLDVSDSTKLTATRVGAAAPGGHEIVVQNLARAEQRSYTFTQGAATLDVGGTQVTLDGTEDGAAAAEKINASGAPFYAVYVTDPVDGDRLVLTAKDTSYKDPNAPDALHVTGAAWTSTESLTAGVDARFTVDGTQKTSASNVVTTAVPGLQLTLKATGTTSVTVGPPAPDNEAVKAKVQAFVDQYNSTIDFIRGKLTEKRVPNATNSTDARKGVLFGDTQLTGVLSQLRNMISGKTGATGAITAFADLGVSTGTGSGGASNADALAGKLTLDANKLTDALTTNRLDVKAFMTDPDATKGISAKLTALLDPIAKIDGLVDQRADSAGNESKRIDDQIAVIEDRITAKQERLKLQFAAMEQALAQSQSQGSWLAAQLPR